MKLFETKGLSASYGTGTVISALSLSIEEGGFTALIGPNGAGKSTLLKMLSGILAPSAGDLLFRGKALSAWGAREFAREVAVVHQFVENLLPFSVEEFVRMGRFPHRSPWLLDDTQDRIHALSAIETSGIAHLARRPMTGLSGGERQLAFIARALAQGSPVILLDEPVTHLDIRHAAQVMDLLHARASQGTTVIAALHDINMASDYCDRIIALREGALFAQGAPREVVRYDLIETLFDTVCVVFDNPMTHKPYTFPVPEYLKSR
ncbi:MAG: ABC transporter ATP-binding protein [Spirochaetes bacterium]|nr:MAG: ABC transporter ATP-binding protein [Spirochaetota bacterium]